MTKAEDPLSPSDFQTLREKAFKPSVKVPVSILSGTGLYPHEFVHLHQDWITFRDKKDDLEHPLIRIPEYESCRRNKIVKGGTSGGAISRITDREGPCHYCKKRGDQDRFNADYRTDHNRVIPVVDQPAADTLEWWFTQYETIPWTLVRGSRLRRVSVDVINRPINLTGLRHTFVARASAMGLNQDTIISHLGVRSEFATGRIREILRESCLLGDDPDGYRKQRTFRTYLSILDSNEPMTVSEISEELNVTRNTVRKMLRKYEQYGLVELTQEGFNQHKKPKWTNSAPPDVMIRCLDENCSKEFYSLKQVTHHMRRHH